MKKVLSALTATAMLLALTLASRAQKSSAPAPTTRPTSEAKTGGPAGTGKESTPSQDFSRIRVAVNVVNVLFTVTDKKNRLLVNLKQDDFKILEDNSTQSIQYFSRETNLPLRIGMLIDTSNSVRDRLRFEQEAAVEFLQANLRPRRDLALVVGFDVEPQLVQDYSDDIDKLSRAVRSLQAGGGTGLYDAIYFVCREKMLFFPPPEPYLRRALVIISDGLDNQSEHSREEALAMAQRAEVTLYAISTSRSGELPGRGDKVLTRLAQETGGRAFFPFAARELYEDFSEIGRELRSQYNVGYVSTNQKRDGSFRNITVLARDKDLRIRSKTGYFAPSQ